jgi:hypothetical protein
MSLRHPRPSVVLLLLAACTPELNLPPGAQITCASDADCPEPLRCQASSGRCVEPSTNEPPAVTLGTIPRSTGTVSVPLTVLDPEGDPCTLAVQADLGAGFVDIAVTPTTVVASPAGVATTLSWDAAAVLPGGGGVYREGLRLRVVPSDASAAGAVVISAPFAHGNEAPVVGSVSVDDDPVAGITVVRFTLADGASDPVHVSGLELSPEGDFSDAIAVGLTGGKDGNFPSGALVDLTTAPAAAGGAAHSITWNSARAGALARPAARIRVRVTDEPFGAESASTASPAFALRNQTPPRIEPVFVKSDGALHNGLVPITYLLVDDEGDPADVLFEFSVDEGQTWAPCSEATLPASEGVEALAASRGGVAHTWIWDSSASIALFSPSVRVRATASGALSGPGPTTPLVQQRPVGLAPAIGREILFADPVRQTAFESAPYATVAQLDGDGIPDLAYVTLPGQLGVRLGDAAGGAWAGTFGAAVYQPLFADGGAVAAGDVTCDGVVDLVTTTNGNYFSGGGTPGVLQLWRGAGNGTFAPAPGSPIATGVDSEDLHVADLDGDGHLDVVLVARGGSAKVLFSDGAAPACALAEVVDLAGGGGFTIGVGDLDADGLQDVVFGDGTVYHGAPRASGSRFTAGTKVPGLNGGAVDLADVDGDGDADVVAPGFAARSDGRRGFDATSTFSVGAGPMHVAAADLNRDGLLDLVSVNFSGGDLSVQMATDRGGVWEGGFVDAFSIEPSFGLQPNQISTADLDGDGQLDLVVADRSAGVETLVSVSGSAFGAGGLRGAQVFATDEFESANAFPADLDLDGVTDLLVGGFDGSLVLGSRAGRAPGGLFLPGERVDFADDVVMPAPGDFDADGFFDLVVAYPTISFSFSPAVTASLFHGRPRQGGASFVAGTAPPLSVTTELARCAESLFIDGDPWLDVLVVTSGAGAATARPFLGSATGDFTAGPTTGLGGEVWEASTCELADLDGDGLLDLALQNGSLWKLAPSGALTLFGTVPPGTFALVDFDRDGIVDVLTARTLPTGVEVRRGGGVEGVGDGTFTLVDTASGFPGTITDLVAVDVDADGTVDLVATTNQRKLAVAAGHGSRGVGDGTYAAPVIADSPTADLHFATLLDANGDLVPDVAALDRALTKPKALTVVTAMRTSVVPPWRTRVGSGLASRLLGADAAPAEANLLGVQLGGSFTQLPFASGQVGFIDHARGSVMQSAMFPQLLRGSRLAGVPARLTPLTLPWTWSGARSLVRVDGPGGALRLEVRERFGPRLQAGQPQRAGLSLSASPQRGVVVELPVLPGRDPVDGKVRVYLRTLDFTRAAGWPGDALEGDPAGASYLPVEGGEDVIHPRFGWAEAAAVADLATGTGPRFVVVRTRTPAVIRVVLDADATLQAFAVP